MTRLAGSMKCPGNGAAHGSSSFGFGVAARLGLRGVCPLARDRDGARRPDEGSVRRRQWQGAGASAPGQALGGKRAAASVRQSLVSRDRSRRLCQATRRARESPTDDRVRGEGRLRGRHHRGECIHGREAPGRAARRHGASRGHRGARLHLHRAGQPAGRADDRPGRGAEGTTGAHPRGRTADAGHAAGGEPDRCFSPVWRESIGHGARIDGDEHPEILGLVAGGVGVAGLVVGGVFGVKTLSQVDQQKTDCASPTLCPHPAAAASDHSTGETDRTISTVGFIAGGALLVGGAIVFLTAHRAAERPGPAGALIVVPSVGPGSAAVFLRGQL